MCVYVCDCQHGCVSHRNQFLYQESGCSQDEEEERLTLASWLCHFICTQFHHMVSVTCDQNTYAIEASQQSCLYTGSEVSIKAKLLLLRIVTMTYCQFAQTCINCSNGN